MNYLNIVIISLLLPSVLLFSDSCLQAYNKICELHPAAWQKEIDPFILFGAIKEGYEVCLEDIYNLNKSQTEYTNLQEAFTDFTESINDSYTIQELLNDLLKGDLDRFKHALSSLRVFMSSHSIKREAAIDMSIPMNAKGFLSNFLRYSGIMMDASRACISQTDSLIQHTFESLYMVWTLGDPLEGIKGLLNLNVRIESLIDVCPGSWQSSWRNFLTGSWLMSFTFFQNLFRRSGLLMSNCINFVLAITKMNFLKAGSWLGVLLYNIVSASIYDDPLLPNPYNE